MFWIISCTCCKFFFQSVAYLLINFFLIEAEVIYNVVLVSGVQPSDSDMCVCLCVCVSQVIQIMCVCVSKVIQIRVCVYFFRFFPIIGYNKILNIIPGAI